MSTLLSFQQESWFPFLPDHGQRLVVTSQELYDREARLQSAFSSYSFVVFPMAKAYEGFIKSYLHQMGILPKKGYQDHKFRIGRALNPDISPQHKDEWWLYDDLERACSPKTARLIWDTWVECRNRIFHFYFDDEIPMPLSVAKQKLLQLSEAMDEAVKCGSTLKESEFFTKSSTIAAKPSTNERVYGSSL